MLVPAVDPFSALVFLGGTFPGSPGVQDGAPAVGPDIQLSGLVVDPMDPGLFLDGDDLNDDTLHVDLSAATSAVLELIPTRNNGYLGIWTFATGVPPFAFINFENLDITGGLYDVLVSNDRSNDDVLDTIFGLGTGEGFAGVSGGGDGMADETTAELVNPGDANLRLTTTDGVATASIDLDLVSMMPMEGINSLSVNGSDDDDTLLIRDNGDGLPEFLGLPNGPGPGSVDGRALGAHSNDAYQDENFPALAANNNAEDVTINFNGGGQATFDDLEIEFSPNSQPDVGYYTDDPANSTPVAATKSGVINVAAGAFTAGPNIGNPVGDFRLSFEGLEPVAMTGGGGGTLIVDATATPTVGELRIADDIMFGGPTAIATGANNGVSAIWEVPRTGHVRDAAVERL